MKRIKHVFSHINAWENWLVAFKKARRGKRSRPEVSQFEFALEYELTQLQHEYHTGEYLPSGYKQIAIYDRKPRQISVAPFRDRVAQHALMNVIEPLLDKRFIYDCYACRKNKGVHLAVDRYQQWARRYPYVMKLDIASYFASIDHELLKQKLCKVIADKSVLHIFERIIDSAPLIVGTKRQFANDDLVSLMRPTGLPIGNLTSQFLANLYLNDFDHFVKNDLKVKGYGRYVDDFVLFADSKEQLWGYLEEIKRFLEKERLLIHPKKCWVQPVSVGVEYLGYRIWPHKRRLRADNGYKFRRRLKGWAKQYKRGEIELFDFRPNMMSWLGHAKHGSANKLIIRMFSEHVFTRGEGANTSHGSGRVLEQ